VSVVSHGQGALAAPLLAQIAAQRDPRVVRVVLTHNLPDAALAAPAGGWPFELIELFNRRPAGFAANHNRAFRHCASAWFCVLNPDVMLPDARIWQRLLEAAAAPLVGCAYPVLLNPDGTPQDQEREAVTPLALWRRHVRRLPQRRADWVSAAFWLVPSAVWSELGGLDEGFYLYCEDTDFCLRLQSAGWRLARADAHALHMAQRASRRPGRRMAMHLRSLLRLWLRPPLWRFLASSQARQ